MTWKLRIAILLVLAGTSIGVQALCSLEVAEARPGGGHSTSRSRSSSFSRSSSSRSSFSRSSSRSSSNSSFRISGGGCSDDGDGAVFFLCLIGLVVVGVVVAAVKSNESQWDSGSLSLGLGSSFSFSPPPPQPKQPVDLAPLRAADPELSQAVFEDFVYQLYAAAHRRRSTADQLLLLQPYFSQRALDQLAARGTAPSQVVIGTLRIAKVGHKIGTADEDKITVYLEATHHTEPPIYAVESWVFARLPGVVSKPPVRARTFPCPSCGAPWQTVAGVGAADVRICQHCGEDIKPGRFDWYVEWIQLTSEERALASLTGTVEEYGTDLPTISAVDVGTQMAAITADDPEVTFEAFKARVELVYERLNQTWNAADLTAVRGFVTTPLRDYLQYWLDEYKRQGLRNYLDSAHVETIRLSKITRDKHFDAITVRVHAAGCDYTLNASGGRVGGSRTQARRYSEYWTFLRASSRRGKVTTEPKCPNCGAPISISDTGDCTHCDAAIETGAFDWLLSKIEQDDNYAG